MVQSIPKVEADLGGEVSTMPIEILQGVVVAQGVEILQGVESTLRLDLLGRLVLAVVLGGAVGLERELFEKPAGLRTNILICVGAALFTHLSLQFTSWGSPGGPADPGRIAAQIVSGIGFLGAGTIIQSRGSVTGLTTAATIWVVAAIGMAVGAGALAAAVGGTILILLVLAGLGAWERRLKAGWTTLEILVQVKDESGELKKLVSTLEEMRMRITIAKVSRDGEIGVKEALLRSRVPRERIPELSEALFNLPEIRTLRPD
jgi:putative Mg2+ transporter-C (MgtC) family protein